MSIYVHDLFYILKSRILGGLTFSGQPFTASNGSGFIIQSDGLILTNAHVVINKPHTNVQVKLVDGRTFLGVVEDLDQTSDLATVGIHGWDTMYATRILGAKERWENSRALIQCSRSKIVLDTCEAIWEELHAIYLAVPNREEWCSISMDIERSSGMPNCVGAIDGKHINIVCPKNAGSQYFNYKKRHSIVLLAVCDAKYSFTLVDVGANGSQSDGGIFKNSSFGLALERDQLDIPSSQNLPNSEINFPFYFVGDAAFPLKRYLMRPFPGQNLSPPQQHFNTKLSRARVTIENSFGILAARWRILRNDLHCTPDNAKKIIKATLVLHNFLRFHDVLYCPPNYADHFNNNDETIPGQWRQDEFILERVQSQHSHNATREVFEQRNKLCTFLSENIN